ncbi:MAG: CYTH domain-containing protein [Bdellovibrionales bacterium]|nr:CYTH domain-containing protein [Bdellovibrionales bacterium]
MSPSTHHTSQPEENSPKKATRFEIERTFEPKGREYIPIALDKHTAQEITQWYLQFAGESSYEDRVRRTEFADGRVIYERQQKSPGGMVREETEPVLLSDDEVRELHLESLPRIEKTRYFTSVQGIKVEIDFYHGPLEGKAKIEVEFRDQDGAIGFVPPEWFGEEITDEPGTNDGDRAQQLYPDFCFPSRMHTPVRFTVEDGLNRVYEEIEALRANLGRPVIVSVAGGSASGKTSKVAKSIQARFGSPDLLSLDDFSKGDAWLQSQRALGREHLSWDHPEYIDSTAALSLLKSFRDQGIREFPKRHFDFQTGEPSIAGTISFGDVLVVEGLFALSDSLMQVADYGVFVDIGPHGRLMRRLLRDVSRTTMSPNEILKYFLSTVHEAHEEHVQPSAKVADIVLTNEYKPEIEATRSGLLDNQVKFPGKISAFSVLGLGAHHLGSGFQTDVYFAPTDRDFSETGELLRIRGNGTPNQILTYKGPRLSNGTRPRFEAEIDEEASAQLRKVYDGQAFVIQKLRESFLLDGVVISFDSNLSTTRGGGLRSLENHIELRSSTAEQDELIALAGRLGLDPTKLVSLSYAEM